MTTPIFLKVMAYLQDIPKLTLQGLEGAKPCIHCFGVSWCYVVTVTFNLTSQQTFLPPICRVPLEENKGLYISRGLIRMYFIFCPLGHHREIIIKVTGSFSLCL